MGLLFRKVLPVMVVMFIPLNLAAQSKELVLGFEAVGQAGSGEHAPFWHTSNRQGLPSVRNKNGFTHVAALGDIKWDNGLGVDYGADLGFGAGLENDFFLHQLYLNLDYKWLGVSAGMQERWSDKNPYLSSGALTWSGNCRPIPELRAGIPEYVRVPIFGRWFSVKGHVGYGQLTDNRWRKKRRWNNEKGQEAFTNDILFHTKSAFLRFGDEERFPLQVTLGLEMNNLFGGTRYIDSDKIIFPADAGAYWTVLFPFHQVEGQGKTDGDNLGSWHLNIDYKLHDWHIGAYYEHFYEDHSSMLGIEYKNKTDGSKDFIFYGFRRNWFDGLFGIEVKAPGNVRFFRNAVLEFMNTRGQCGPICHSVNMDLAGMHVIEEIDGRDGMYIHSLYDSYSHWGYMIGSPVIVSPAYNTNGSNRPRSYRVRMFHLGVDGELTGNAGYRLLATTTRHWGLYGEPLKEVERVTSVMLECSYKLGEAHAWKLSLSGSMDFDSGDLLGNNRGIMLTISKQWKVL